MTTKALKVMKFIDWGVFVDDDKNRTFEIKLPENLAVQVSDFLNKQATENDVLGMGKPNAILDDCDTKGKITW